MHFLNKVLINDYVHQLKKEALNHLYVILNDNHHMKNQNA